MENNNFYNLTDEDVETLRLLDLQLYGNLVFIVSDVLSYISTVESINLVYSKYENTSENLPDPDTPALEFRKYIWSDFIYVSFKGNYGNLRKRFKLTCIWTIDMLYLD